MSVQLRSPSAAPSASMEPFETRIKKTSGGDHSRPGAGNLSLAASTIASTLGAAWAREPRPKDPCPMQQSGDRLRDPGQWFAGFRAATGAKKLRGVRLIRWFR